MLFTVEQTKEILTAETFEEMSEVLKPIWNVEEHYPCFFKELSRYSLEEKRTQFGRQMEVVESAEEPGRFFMEFHGDLSDEELDNVAGGCQPHADYFLKPVIYLYPQKETEVSVKVEKETMKLTCTYPEYKDGWEVTALPEGTLKADGKTYSYLYWEGEGETNWSFSEGFCVAGKDTAAFLEESLAKLGLNQKESNEFIVYWLPRMQGNAYNLISFQKENYDAAAPLSISPAPDTVIRVFMAYKPLKNAKEIKPQELSAPERNGFTVIEWGGTSADENKKVFVIE